MIQIADKIQTVTKRCQQAEKEYEVLSRLHRLVPGLVPVPIAFQGDLLITEKVQGGMLLEPNAPDALARRACMRASAEALASLHGVEISGFASILPQEGSSFPDFLLRCLNEHLSVFSGNCLSAALVHDIREKFPAILKKISHDTNFGFVHGDFEFQNLLVMAGERVMVFDFEDAALGWQVEDVAMFTSKLHLLNAVSAKPNPALAEDAEAFVQAYIGKRPLSRATFELTQFVYFLRARFSEGFPVWHYESLKNFYKKRKYEKFIRHAWKALGNMI